MRRLALTVAFGLALTACSSARRPPTFLASAAEANRPLSPAVRSNGFLFLAGQLGSDSTGKMAPGGIQPETRQAMIKIKAILERHGSSMDRVVKCTVFMMDMKEWGAMNEVYVTFFAPGKRPTRSAVGVSGLAANGRVEIECMAQA